MEVDSKDNAAPVAVAAVESTCSQCLLENLPHLQIGKARLSLQSIRNNPEKWYRNATFDQRDLELISAPPVFWLLYDQSSFVRKIVGQTFIGKPKPVLILTLVPLQSRRAIWNRMSSMTVIGVVSDFR